jgi:hypothetical protein
MKIAKERIENSTRKKNACVHIIDKKNSTLQSLGTTIKITIPIAQL